MAVQTSGKALWTPATMNLRRGRNPYFVGREQILADIRKKFDDPDTSGKIIALVGMGGAGKSSLALEYALARKLQYDIIWWVTADNPARIAAEMAALGVKLDEQLAAETDLQTVCRAAVRELERRDGWLLIFDNALFPDQLSPFVPWGGAGHILITSRNIQWEPMSKAVPVPPWSRHESVAFLHKRIQGFKDDAVAEKLAAALGDLPLALEQAAACIEQTHVTPAVYLRRFEAYWGELLQRGTPAGEHPNFAAMAWELSFRQIETLDPVAGDLLNLCAFLGPEEIPISMLRDGATLLPQPLSAAAATPMGLTSPMTTLRQFSLAETPDKSVGIHRVVAMQARQRLSDQDRMKWSTAAVNLASQAFPFDSQNHNTWAICSKSLPHVLAATDYAREGHAPAKAVIDLLDRAGKFLLKQGQWQLARDTLEKALAMVNSTYGTRSPRYADIANNLGRARHRLGDFTNAMNLFESAMQIDGVLYGSQDPHMAAVANNFGMTLAAMGKPELAKERFQNALKVYEAHYGPEHLKVASVLNNLGFVLTQLNDLAGAQTALQRAMSIAEKNYGANHPNVACIVTNLAGVLKAHGQLDEAGHLYTRALGINEEAFGPDHAMVARDLTKVGQFMLDKGDFASAVQHLDRAVKISEATLGPNHPRTIARLSELGRAFTFAGNTDRAAQCFVEATKRSRPTPQIPAAKAPAVAAAAAVDEESFSDEEVPFRDPTD
jgi:Tfp pilus assembly protein PilF